METLFFYKRDEFKEAKKEDRRANPTFSLTANVNNIRHWIKSLRLEEDYIWSDK